MLKMIRRGLPAWILVLIAILTTLCGCTQDISAEQKSTIIEAAAKYQTEGGVYTADTYQVVHLKTGDIIYGMLPGQSAFYFDRATVEAGNGSYKTLYALLQIRPHPVYGYRTQLGKYEALVDMDVASGACQANKTITLEGNTETLGDGGGFQYVIIDFKDKLKLVEQNDLHE